MIKISVIVPVYNVEKYIENCILSVLENNLENDFYEIIIVDDGSQDNSIAKIKKYVQGNVKLVTQNNKGLGGARNTGIHHASGDYLLFLDADDIILPNTLKKIVSIAIEYNLDVLEFSAKGILDNGTEIYKISNSTHQKILNGVDYYNSIRYMNSACNKLYKRDFLLAKELFFLERIFIEDFEFNTRVFSEASRVLATDFLVCAFLQTPNSITRNTNESKKQKMIHDIVFVLKQTSECQKNKGSNKANVAFFEERKCFLVATLFFQLFKNGASYYEFKKLKKELLQQQLFFVNYKIHDKNKNWFRIIVVRNSWIYPYLQRIRRILL